MKNKLITMTIVLLSMCTGSCMAAVTKVDYNKNFSANTIMVDGTASGNEQVSVHIVKDGEINSGNIEQNVVYVGQKKSDTDGKFCFVAEVHTSGKYNIFVSSEDITVNSVKIPVEFYNSSDYADVIIQLNTAPTELEFCSIIKNNAVKLGFDDEINTLIDLEKTGKVMYSGLAGSTLPADKYENNQDYYKNCAMMVAANEGKLSSIYNYADNIIEGNEKLSKYWKQYITSVEKETYAVQKLYNRNLSNVNDLEKNISEVLILTATYYPDGYMSLKDLYSDFKDILGIGVVSSDASVYSRLAGCDFNDIGGLITAYKNAVNMSNAGINTGGSSGGSGGSGGGSKITMGGSSITQMPIVDNNTGDIEVIPLKFIDLGSVRWAYPSISILFEAGIVSGVNETEFLPENNVKREEFTKMLVVAMNENKDGYKSVFTDVDGSVWYADYVACAYEKGIVNGISDTEFGVSRNITRQDMAVMIYRAMLSKGYERKYSSTEFADKESISGYAMEAISELSDIGVINGVGDNMFAPEKTATRAEAAVIIERALQYLR